MDDGGSHHNDGYDDGVELVHGGPSGVTFIGTLGMIHVDRDKLISMPAEILKRVDAALREEFGALRANAFDHAYFGAEVHRHWICTPAKRAIGKCDRKAGTPSSYIIPAANKQKHARKTGAKLAPLARVPIE